MKSRKTIIIICGLALIDILSFAYLAPISAAAKKKPTPDAKMPMPNQSRIPAKRVLSDFAQAYTLPVGGKTLKIEHNKKIRNFNETKGETRMQAQAQEVAHTLLLTDCGIRMRDIWEVTYYKLETEWIFQEIKRIKSIQLTKPTKKMPAIGIPETKRLVADSIQKSYGTMSSPDVTVLETKPYWDLCTPNYKVISKIVCQIKDEVRNTVSTYECLIATLLANRGTGWEPVKSSCIYRGKENDQCHFGTFCLEISSATSIPGISDSQALALLHESFKKEYALRKGNAVIEKFSLVKFLSKEDYGTKLPCIISATFVIDENKEVSINDAGIRKKGLSPVRAVYDCIVFGHLQYSLFNNRWEGVIDSCCASENDTCGKTCDNPSKWCKRLGEK